MTTVRERFIMVTKVSSATQASNNDDWIVLLSGDVTSKAKESLTYHSQISMHYSNESDANNVRIGDKVNF